MKAQAHQRGEKYVTNLIHISICLTKGQVDLELWLVWLTLRQTVKAVKPRQIFGVENFEKSNDLVHN